MSWSGALCGQGLSVEETRRMRTDHKFVGALHSLAIPTAHTQTSPTSHSSPPTTDPHGPKQSQTPLGGANCIPFKPEQAEEQV